ncbi:NF-kappa-B inhibitor epsilon [Pyxicephalus adspersus]|uniref:NF-kappa-B inhibitor epsilon n=1 Tax=Pyxicephalus adspersus TaxID=30357 RepID=UPI003B5AC6BC
MMSEEWEGKTFGLHPEDVRFDSGLAESLQDEGLSRFPGPSHEESSIPHQSEQLLDAQDAERNDSTYGSSSIIEGLTNTGDPAQTLIEEPDILVAERAPQTGTLPPSQDTHFSGTEPNPQTASLPPRGVTESTAQINGFTFLSEEGDTLLHLAVIHNIPQLSLNFISLAPKEVLDIQNDLYQVGGLCWDSSPADLTLEVWGAGYPIHYGGSWLSLPPFTPLCPFLEPKGDSCMGVIPFTLRLNSGVACARNMYEKMGHYILILHLACENQHLDCARILLRGPRGPQNLQLQNWKGLTCLHIATMKRNLPLVSLLLDSGANINSQEGTSGKTALHLAVEMLDNQLVNHLLQYRPHVDAFMYNGCTPLHLAVGRKDVGLARLLCQAGADILQRNREGDTPQDLAEGNNLLLPLLPFDDLMISGKPVVTTA